MIIEDYQAKKSKGWPMAKNERGKPQRRPKATFNILMAKYKEGRAGIRGMKIELSGIPNWTVWFP
jgi:hypothetical protein